MEAIVFYGAMILVCLVQVCLTAFVQKGWIKCLPAVILALLTGLCFLGYALSGWTNWGYWILMAGLVVLLAGDAVAAVVGYLLRRLVRKK